MSTYVVVGLQYGDEGKGKITDVLSAKSDYVVRFQGGDNAGHTVYVGEDKFVLHLLPSGVLQCKGKCIIANGVVVNPKAFMHEISQIEEKNYAEPLFEDENITSVQAVGIAFSGKNCAVAVKKLK